MDGREVHRIEYEQCAADARAAGTRGLQVVYIFLSAIVVALAVVVGQLVSRPREEHDWFTVALVAIAAAVGVALACALEKVMRRAAWVQQVTYARMRNIEWLLGMRKNIYVDILDNWKKRCDREDWDALPAGERRFLERLQGSFGKIRPCFFGRTVLTWVARLIMAAWIALFLSELGIVIWNVK